VDDHDELGKENVRSYSCDSDRTGESGVLVAEAVWRLLRRRGRCGNRKKGDDGGGEGDEVSFGNERRMAAAFVVAVVVGRFDVDDHGLLAPRLYRR